MILKTKETRKILEPINAQIRKLKQLLPVDNKDDLQNASSFTKSLFCERLYLLARNLDDLSKETTFTYQELKAKITDSIEEFCLTVNVDDIPKCAHRRVLDDALENVSNKLTLALKSLEDLESLPLRQKLQDRYDCVKEMSAFAGIENFQNIKDLGFSLLEIVKSLRIYKKNLTSRLLSERISLYLCQLYTTFNMLVELTREQHQLKAPIYICKKYICERICVCLEMMLKVLNDSCPTMEDENFEKENNFVSRMDLILDVISEIPKKVHKEQVNECEVLWLQIEDVFSHAMAIAQVCYPYDFEAITGACHSIISEYENLKIQLHSEAPDSALNNLFMNTLNDALYRLERKVNVSMLRLVMEVFSDPFSALKKLVMPCGNSLSAKNRSKTDLTDAIDDFDQLTDKTMQIGRFAIACCKNINWTIAIQNCLAGLESLETELVSGITAFYLHPDNKEMRANVKLLTVQWQSEMNKLHDTINRIIDSAAYCQIVLDDLQERISVMSDCLDNRQPVTQHHVQGVVQRALSLSSQITSTINDIGTENIERHTIMMIRELKAAIVEADAASKHLLVDNNATEPQQLRVIKRCELLLNVVKRLQPAMINVMNESVLINTNYRKSGIGQGDTYNESILNFPTTVYGLPRDEKSITYIRTPYTVKNYKPPLTIQPANSTPRTARSSMSCLMPYIKRGRMMRTEQSIMYKTPVKCKTEEKNKNKSARERGIKAKNPYIVRQHLFSRDSFTSCNSTDDNDSLTESIDLTNILEGLTVSSSTIWSDSPGSTLIRKTENPIQKLHLKSSYLGSSSRLISNAEITAGDSLKRLINSKSLMKEDKLEKNSANGGGDASLAIETPERLSDIKRIDQKLDILQKKQIEESKEQ